MVKRKATSPEVAVANRYNLTKMTKEKQVSNQQYEEVRREQYREMFLFIRLVRVWICD